MKKAYIVIGSNYGDEGKGLAVASAAAGSVGKTLNILINGGAQRGHTVEFPDGRRHVFRHFGSASVFGAVSCADEDFMVNPILFLDEREELRRTWPEACLEFLASANCRVTSVYDMMVNQYIEDYRANARHGSCGLGIYETRRRYERTDWALQLGRLMELTKPEYIAYCRKIAEEYIPNRLREEGISADEQWYRLLCSEGMIANSWEDLCRMKTFVHLFTDWAAARCWDTLIFEAGQGLALDEDNKVDSPHLTPSHTTSAASAGRIRALGEAYRTEILYVTRSYLTRHGAGPLPTECPMKEISSEIIDITNMPNPYQQTIRYGWFDADAVVARIAADRAAAKAILPDVTATVMVTHMNETDGKLFGSSKTVQQLAEAFDRLYISWQRFPEVLKNKK